MGGPCALGPLCEVSTGGVVLTPPLPGGVKEGLGRNSVVVVGLVGMAGVDETKEAEAPVALPELEEGGVNEVWCSCGG